MSCREGQGRGHSGSVGCIYTGRGRGSGHYTPTLNKIKVYAVHLKKTSLIMVRNGHQTRCGRLGKRLSIISAPSMGTTSATNYRTKQRSTYPILNTLNMYSQNKNSAWNQSIYRGQG